MFLITFMLITIFHVNQAMIGFDCGTSDPVVNTYSLLDAGECDFHENNVNITNSTIELIQVAEFRSIKIIQCKIEIKRTVLGCGMFSHLLPTTNAVQEYISDISHEKCKFVHETGIYKYDNFHTIADLKVNSTTTRGLDLAGSVVGESCTGASYADKFGSWTNVLVQGSIKITLLEQYGQVNLNTDKIRLNSGTICKFSDQHCIDMEAGHSFWSLLPNNDCFQTKYDILYQGPVKRISSPSMETIYTLTTTELSFSLAVKESIKVCDRILIRTEHPKLFIYEKNARNILYDNDITVNSKIGVFNLDIFTYMNSKFVHVERHFRTQVETLYLHMLKEKCELERNVIQNSLSIASISPDEFAYNLMKKPGYIARLAGEVVHVIKCTPIEVKILHTNNCYSQLPVTSGNQTLYMLPKTHILLKTGTQINCNSIVPQYYKVGNSWITLTPKPRKINSEVKTFNPKTEITWKAEKMDSLATSGIYSQEDLKEFQQHIMFPMEKAALINVIARRMQGEDNDQEGLLTNLLTEKTLSHIAESTWKKFIEKLITFGSFSSAIIMILIILQTIKMIIDTIIRGYTLHTIYGWSLHLLGAIFSSITHLLILLKQEKSQTIQQKQKVHMYEETELHEIKVARPQISQPIQPPPLPSKPPASCTLKNSCNENISNTTQKVSNQVPKKQHGIFSLN